ncbi:unnamed protein product [Callosobruchus maculatus]|uniref:Protein cueball n=1 Tax=Callosobruchus maculatus TaxID=64391 RepID=A0A653BDE6_CALMS|nr:unnamed protein product [Callosobruchus maculatus]
MTVRLTTFLFLAFFVAGKCRALDWELALVLENQIKLLHSNGELMESRTHSFNSLKALAYDNVREQFIVSDMDATNDTIYTVQLTKETDTTVPIIKELPGDVQGLAVDPIDDILYWTDAINHTINYVHLNGTFYESKPLFVFDDEEKRPHSIVVDICKRYIYWTNPSKKPTIERAKLDGTDRQVLVSTSIISPEGLAIDYKAQRLYWADSRIGSIAGRIESIGLDGEDRRVEVERNTMQPFGIAVDEEAIYWTDTNNKGLYKFLKDSDQHEALQKLLEFDKVPMGLVANNNIVKEMPDCTSLEKAIETHKRKNGNVDISNRMAEDGKEVDSCLNDGELIGHYCKCKRGFMGKQCETSICHNYCLTGNCYLSSIGKPVCRCDKEYDGDRCQRNKCDGYCLNGGECHTYSRSETICHCQTGFFGGRCEYNWELCQSYCSNQEVLSEVLEIQCRCDIHRNRTAAFLSADPQQEESILSKLNDPLFYLGALLSLSVLVILSLIVYIRTIYKRRPRIKKRIIVNKNVTPLTYRPQPTTEQCEITIENCCNMNVCETPCFEPREDRKKLLSSMAGDDLY